MKRFFILLICICTLLSGCSADTVIKDITLNDSTSEEETIPEEISTQSIGQELEETTVSEEIGTEVTVDGISIVDEAQNLSEEELAVREAYGLTLDNIAKCMIEQKGLYAYENMDASLRPLYAQILLVLEKSGEDVVLYSLDPDAMSDAFSCVLIDHPEIFYVKGYTCSKYTRDDSIMRIAFSGTYTMDQNQITTMQNSIDSYVDTCLNGMDKTLDDYGKVKSIYEYLIHNTTYNMDALENQNICSVFVYGESICQGYAKAMQYLLQQIGIPCVLVEGSVDTGEGHAWDLVRVNGKYYYVDPTWGDAFYEFTGDSDYPEGATGEEKINYDYLLVTTDEICRTHTISSVVDMPECSSKEDNYYVREGAYFTQMDEEKLTTLFNNAYENGSEMVTLKCATEELYLEMIDELITNQKVFVYANRSNKSLSYMVSMEQYSISFWL